MSAISLVQSCIRQLIVTENAPNQKPDVSPEPVRLFNPKKIRHLINPALRPKTPMRFENVERLKRALEKKGALVPVKKQQRAKRENSREPAGLIDFRLGPFKFKVFEKGNNEALFKATWKGI